tara:strand:- start:318 stop:626 length:309 start_codon:yes stop_codon:yes gene_type:complete
MGKVVAESIVAVNNEMALYEGYIYPSWFTTGVTRLAQVYVTDGGKIAVSYNQSTCYYTRANITQEFNSMEDAHDFAGNYVDLADTFIKPYNFQSMTQSIENV